MFGPWHAFSCVPPHPHPPLDWQRKTKVRDLTFKVAEPEVAYDPMEAEAKLWRQPLTWLKRNVDIFVPLTLFITRVIWDIQTNQELKVGADISMTCACLSCGGLVLIPTRFSAPPQAPYSPLPWFLLNPCRTAARVPRSC